MYLLLFQHLTEQLELDLSPLDYMMKCYPAYKDREEMRKLIGRYGLTGKQQVGLGYPSRCYKTGHFQMYFYLSVS